jgi:hypothetical protein
MVHSQLSCVDENLVFSVVALAVPKPEANHCRPERGKFYDDEDALDNRVWFAK